MGRFALWENGTVLRFEDGVPRGERKRLKAWVAEQPEDRRVEVFSNGQLCYEIIDLKLYQRRWGGRRAY